MGVTEECKTTTNCNFSCLVHDPYDVSLRQFAPYISWERYDPDNDTYWGLSDSHWAEMEQVTFSSSHFKTKCFWYSNQSYKCEFVEKRCCTPLYDGGYRARVKAAGRTETLLQYEAFPLGKYELLNIVENFSEVVTILLV